jgi:FkbM family methyltransferase
MEFNRVGRFLGYCTKAIHTVGVVPTCQWVFGTAQNNLKWSTPSSVRVQPRYLKHPVKLRACTSDPFVFRQIMIEKEYLPLGKLPIFSILDLGANIGLASAWFLSQFPDARVFAVEADADNWKACNENLAPYRERARVIRGAAWSQRTTLVLHRKSCAADNYVKEPARNGAASDQVEGWDIASLVQMSGFEHIDLAKIDVEGAEAEIFRSNIESWLPLVRNLCIELHGEACRETFFTALKDYDYEYARSGELDICLNLKPKAA